MVKTLRVDEDNASSILHAYAWLIDANPRSWCEADHNLVERLLKRFPNLKNNYDYLLEHK